MEIENFLALRQEKCRIFLISQKNMKIKFKKEGKIVTIIEIFILLDRRNC
jgi:hypothetical protein